jgi:hypothetical protein
MFWYRRYLDLIVPLAGFSFHYLDERPRVRHAFGGKLDLTFVLHGSLSAHRIKQSLLELRIKEAGLVGECAKLKKKKKKVGMFAYVILSLAEGLCGTLYICV